ncbi:zf-HC2 domain-containing protein [Mucilaginibacter mali]|uniref:Zf-HC2 domain-containing protein n=1 Tax=Mucilaginibacter mali TaxID=2740462 RepID=A0A7D4UMT6_9SPHI|nr:zf-HC2 domain-containing protein [Mucilaginibacter mali]QKJ31401.1 zf-HC2 domain-containing protein [Mucilaginibacter mali]
MNSIEEKLWAYIDGTCTAAEREQISALIEHDAEYRQQYEELLQLHTGFGSLELDEPPMAFTYNVMEQIRTQEASVPLKAAINKRIIYAIAAFFVLTITVLLIFALRDINWSSGSSSVQLQDKLKLPQVNNVFTSKWMQGFLFFDLVLGMFLLDSYLRKRDTTKRSELAA